MATNRWEDCRLSDFESGCLQSDAGGILNVGNVESLSIATAACLYLLEGRKRRQKENLEALEVILAFQQAGAKLSFSRNSALELLSEGGLWLDGLDLSGTILDELNACGARWREVNLNKASKALHPSSLHAAVLISQGSEQIERFATCILELQR